MKISAKRWAYLFQPLLIGLYSLFVFLTTSFSDSSHVFDSISVSSLVITAFILFVMPHAPTAKLRIVAKGYCFALLVGLAASYISYLLYSYSGWSKEVLPILLAVSAMLITAWLMIGFNGKHPPALGLPLGMTTTSWGTHDLLVIIIAVALVLCLKKMLTPYLQTL